MVQINPFELLGVSPAASEAEVSAAYRHLVEVFHPDRWRDASPDVLDEARRWIDAIDRALEVVLQGVREHPVPPGSRTAA